ncbi:hypothetical protein TEA_001399 [Camellia sinensis var. sinensis]|uniref:Uncharacterized protein n=1 Tax=Camellia sinensis var. sinensis TaxID=542762 RepID=A0A4S4EP09_CAMSN|nr:hypothetical protein TEA_001399 [Camellia sinensis var. sinensis]
MEHEEEEEEKEFTSPLPLLPRLDRLDRLDPPNHEQEGSQAQSNFQYLWLNTSKCFDKTLQLLEEKHSLLGSHSNSTKPVVRKMETEEEEEEDECKTLSNALQEVLHKGSLMDRLQMLEKRDLQLSIYMDEENTSRSSSLTVPISEKIGQSSGLSSSVTKESDEDVVIATFEGRKDPLLIQEETSSAQCSVTKPQSCHNSKNQKRKAHVELNRQAGLNLGLAEIFHQYSIGSKEDGWVYYLRIRRRREKIIKNTPDKDLNDDDFFWVSVNFEDHQAQIPGQRINWKKGEPDFAHLHSLYSYPNLATLRAALRYPERSWAKLLKFEPTYRYSGRRKVRVTDFLLEEAPEPDPTLLEIRLIPLTAEKEMAKRNRVRALLTETNRPEVPPPSQTQPAVVALPSQQPSSSRPSKRARSTPTEQQLVDEDEFIPPPSPQPILQPEQSDRADSSKWAPVLTFQDRNIQETDSVVAEKDHWMAFNLVKSVCLPKDMEHHNNQLNTELKAIRSSTKSMILLAKLEGKKDAEIADLKKKPEKKPPRCVHNVT